MQGLSTRNLCNRDSSQFTESERGTYFLHRKLIYYADKGSLDFMVLCARPECRHEDEDCTAYSTSGQIFWYDGHLYSYGLSAADYTATTIATRLYYELYRSREDGTERETIQRYECAADDGGGSMGATFVEEGLLFTDASLLTLDDATGLYLVPFDTTRPVMKLADTEALGGVSLYDYHRGFLYLSRYDEAKKGANLDVLDVQSGDVVHHIDPWSWDGKLIDDTGLYIFRGGFYEWDPAADTMREVAQKPEGEYYAY